MELLIIYFIKVNVALAVLFTFYKLLFSRDTFFQLRRIMLIIICIISFVYPFLHIPVLTHLKNSPLEQAVVSVYSKLLPEVSIVADGPAAVEEANGEEGGKWFWLIYGIGVTVLFLRTSLELYRIHGSASRCYRFSFHGIHAYQAPSIEEPCSFFNWIFVNPAMHSEKQLKEILIHEQTHVRELHSLDIVLVQLVIIFCWFNPFAWLIRSEMRMNHEYLADKRVIASGCDKKAYQYHLLGMDCTTLAAANLYNNFSVLPLKKRIKMLNRKRTRNIMMSKYLMFIPVTALLIFFSNCSEKPEKTEVATEVTGKATPTEQKVATETETRSSEEETFDVVEEMPEFPGGMKELMRFLNTTIKYPDEALKKKEQGRVIIQFVVDKDGSIENPKVVRGVSSELDKEALRVVNEMPKWTPGKQKGVPVRVKYTIPIMFRVQ